MAKKRCKRAQISLFLIIGLFVLFALGFVSYLASQTEITPRDTTIEQSVSQLVGQCLKKRVIESYSISGLDADRTRRYVDHELLSCADMSLFKDQADISHGDISSFVQISDDTISTEITLPITIKQGESIIRLDSFNYNLPRYRTTKLPIDANGRLTEPVMVRSSDDRLELYLEQGTIARTNDNEPLEEITIHIRSIIQRDPTLLYFTVYDMQPHGAYFSQKAKLALDYVPSYNLENSLSIVKREVDSNFWKFMPSIVNTQTNTVETYIAGFGQTGSSDTNSPEQEGDKTAIFVVTGTTVLQEETIEITGDKGVEVLDTCSNDYSINIGESEEVSLSEIFLVDSEVQNKIVPFGFRFNDESLYDTELVGIDCLENPDEYAPESCLNKEESLDPMNDAMNNKEKLKENMFSVHVDKEDGECSDKSANLVFKITGLNLGCDNVLSTGYAGFDCCEESDKESCQLKELIMPIDQRDSPIESPEACGNKMGIMLHLQDTLLDPREDFWPFLLTETKLIVGQKGWVLETVGIGNDLGNVHSFIQEAKGAGMRPIIRLMPEQDSSGFDPVEFANYAYDIGSGVGDYFVQVCNEPNHESDPGLNNPCYMSADEYAQKMVTFLETLRELDTEKRIKVLNAGLDPKQDAGTYAQTLLSYTVDEETTLHGIDVWATHAYTADISPEEMDLVAHEELPIIITEAGYPVSDPKYQSLCPGEDITKLFYNCLNPFASREELEDSAQRIPLIEEDCENVEWERCTCKPTSCEKEVWDEQKQSIVTTNSCENCLDEGYTQDQVDFCCKECTYWCVIDWDNAFEDWRNAHHDYSSFMQSSLAELSNNPDVIGIIPFLLIDGKEMTGKVVKFDYECSDASNWRPYYWEYVEYRGEDESGNEVPIHRACKDATDPEMPDPYRYPVMDQNSGAIPTENCMFAESAYGYDPTGTSTLPPRPDAEDETGTGAGTGTGTGAGTGGSATTCSCINGDCFATQDYEIIKLSAGEKTGEYWELAVCRGRNGGEPSVRVYTNQQNIPVSPTMRAPEWSHDMYAGDHYYLGGDYNVWHTVSMPGMSDEFKFFNAHDHGGIHDEFWLYFEKRTG